MFFKSYHNDRAFLFGTSFQKGGKVHENNQFFKGVTQRKRGLVLF